MKHNIFLKMLVFITIPIWVLPAGIIFLLWAAWADFSEWFDKTFER